MIPINRHGCFVRFDFGQAKIGDVWPSTCSDQDIAWFQIAMNNAALMGVVDGLGGAHHESCRVIETGKPFACQPQLQIIAIDEFADDIDLLRILDNFINADDTRMAQCGCCCGFTQKHFPCMQIQRLSAGNLERHDPAQQCITGAPDGSELAASDFFEQFKPADRGLRRLTLACRPFTQWSLAAASRARRIAIQSFIVQVQRCLTLLTSKDFHDTPSVP